MSRPTAAAALPIDSSGWVGIAAIAAITLPTLLAYNVSPSSTFLNQALAFGGWGLLLIALARAEPQARGDAHAVAPVLAALALLAGAAAWSWGPGGLPASLGLSALATLFAAALVLLAGARAASGHAALSSFAAYCRAWLIAALLGALIGAVQVFGPGWTDGTLVAHSSLAGRAVGNLRQPNHLSSILLWGIVALVALLEMRRLALRSAAALVLLLVAAVVLTASRTGLVSVLLLALWGLADRRLVRSTRALLLAAPLAYFAAWQGLALWGRMSEHRFGGEERLAETDISGSRFGIWSDTLAMIREQPWTGVGFGEFNFAWSLSEFPNRPTAFFDHTHNLPLQLLVELGVPLGALVLLLLLWGLARVARLAWQGDGERGVARRSALVMLLMIGLHSLLEYPLWYAYFLLPTAWVWGFAAARPQAAASPGRTGAPRWLAQAAGGVLVAGALLAVLDYRRVTLIFTAPPGAPPLAQRIADGQRSWLFAHHADYAAATTPSLIPRSDVLAPFERSTHYLLDTRLATAWAQALEDSGRFDAARHIAQRLREFRNPASEEFFAACATGGSAPPPFQCQPPSRPLHWRDFLR